MRTASDEISVNVRSLSPEEGRSAGLLEWPSIEKSTDFSDRYEQGEQFYILEGSAQVRVSLYLDGQELDNFSVNTGDLVTVNEPCAMSWQLSGEGRKRRLVLLTPTYTESKLLLGVAAASILSFSLLLVASGN